MEQHFNHQYSSGVSLGVGDRYYAQDLGRDFWYHVDKVGRDGFYKGSKANRIVYGGDVVQGSSITEVDIPETYGYVGFDVTLPNSFAALPPTTLTESLKVPVLVDAQTDYDISSANQDGVTVNYLKAKYKETDSKSRSRAKKAGSYSYEVIDDFDIVLDQTSPGSDELLLCSFVTDGSSTLTITQSSARNASIGNSFFVDVSGNVGIGTTTPSNLLSVGDDIGSFGSIKAVTIGNASGASYLYLGEDLDNYGRLHWNHTLDFLAVITRDSAVTYDNTMVFASGKVATGTNTPSAQFHVGNTASGLSPISTTGTVLISSNQPGWYLYEVDASNDNGAWQFVSASEQLSFSAVNDAVSVASNWAVVNRTTITIDNVNLPNGNVVIGHAGSGSALLHVGDTATGMGSTPTGAVLISSATPRCLWYETDGTANNRLWDMLANGDTFAARVVNDANNSAVDWLIVNRSANSLTAIEFGHAIGSTSAYDSNNVLAFIAGFRNASGTESNVTLRCKKIEIGDWNMDTTTSKVVSYNNGGFRPIDVFATIQNDSGTAFNIYHFTDIVGGGHGGIGNVGTTSLTLYRNTGGFFDSVSFDSTSYNRGWVYIVY